MMSILQSLRGPEGTTGNGARTAETVGGSDTAELRRLRYVITSAERAECTCPDSCERDHEND